MMEVGRQPLVLTHVEALTGGRVRVVRVHQNFMNMRECSLCHKMIDFDEPYCAHESMEESAWLDIKERREKLIADLRNPESEAYKISIIDPIVHAAAVELGLRAAEVFREQVKEFFI